MGYKDVLVTDLVCHLDKGKEFPFSLRAAVITDFFFPLSSLTGEAEKTFKLKESKSECCSLTSTD